MELTATPTYLTTVNSDHTVVLPAEMPIGATVAIVLLPAASLMPNDETRRARFEATLAAIQSAKTWTPPQTLSDSELDVIIEKARKSMPQ